MEKLLEHLYYQSPVEYLLQLTGPQDPHLYNSDFRNQERTFDQYLKTCSLKEYCILIVKAFKEDYPHISKLNVSLLDSDDNGIYSMPDRPLRSTEVSRIDFNYKKARLTGRCDPGTLRNLDYLDECKITFKATQPLAAWVQEALQGKSFVQINGISKTIFTVRQSPILKVETKAKELSIFIDKNSFVEYYFQAGGYED